MGAFQTENILDIRDFKEKGDDLRKVILDAVEDTQRVLVRPYPDRLVITKAQYDDLAGRPEMSHMYDPYSSINQEFFMYQTKHNVMEIEIR